MNKTFDASEFTTRLDLLNSRMDTVIERGLVQAGMQLLNDATMMQPTVPLDEGTLRGSGSVHYDGSFKRASEPMDGVAGSPMRDPLPVNGSDPEVVVGFNTPYAAYLHEHPEVNFTEPGAGAFYLANKLATRWRHYRDIVGAAIREAFR